jgi:putative ABC transport system permease protein
VRNTGGRRMIVAAEMLVVAQIALAATSLAAAGLVARSFIKLQNVDLSFQPGALLVATLAEHGASVGNPATELSTLLKNVDGLKGVQSVSPAFTVPFTGSGGGIDGRLAMPGQSKEEAARNPMLNMELAAPNYFAMLGIPVLSGRAFSDGDREGSTPVVVISKSVAHYFWPKGNAVGQRLAAGAARNYTVVGVVPDTRYRELETARPTVYFPVRQSPFGSGIPSTLLIRTSETSGDIMPALRRAAADANPGLAVVSLSSLETLLDAPRARPRMNAIVLVLFAAAAASLAAIGLFAIVATIVRQRAHELGIRMALGATALNVLTTIMVRGLTLAVAGVAIGIVGAFAVGRLLPALLFEISPTDPATLVAVAALVFAVTTIATFIPARLSMRIDPASALRNG